MTERGKIRNRNYASQLRDFSGLRFGNITPTDIDGFIEFGDKLYIIIESKYRDTEMPYGQELALTRLCQRIAASGRPCYLLIVTFKNGMGDIKYAQTIVARYMYDGDWHVPKAETTLKQAIDILYHKHIKLDVAV